MSTIGTRVDNETKNDVRVIDFQQSTRNPNQITQNNPYPNTITVNFPYPQSFSRCEAAITNLYIYYSWYNITAAFGNNTFQYSVPTDTSTYVTYTVTIPDGFYTIDELSDFFVQVQIFNGSYVYLTADPTETPITFYSWVANNVYYRTTLISNPFFAVGGLYTYASNYAGTGVGPTNSRDPTLTILPSGAAAGTNSAGMYSFSKTLGVSPGTYPATGTTTAYTFNGQYPPVIESTNNVNIAANFINNGSLSANPTIIGKFSPQVAFGEQIVYTPFFPVYLPVSDSFYQSVTLQLQDDNFVPLNIQDPNISGRIIVRGR